MRPSARECRRAGSDPGEDGPPSPTAPLPGALPGPFPGSLGGREEGASVGRPSRRRYWPWLAVLLYLALIFHLSSLQDPLPQLTARIWDKSLHLAEYASLGALLLFALRSSGIGRSRALLLAMAAASLYGATDELHQALVPGRSCDLLDWLADTLGGAIGAGALASALRLVRSRASIRRALGRG